MSTLDRYAESNAHIESLTFATTKPTNNGMFYAVSSSQQTVHAINLNNLGQAFQRYHFPAKNMNANFGSVMGAVADGNDAWFMVQFVNTNSNGVGSITQMYKATGSTSMGNYSVMSFGGVWQADHPLVLTSVAGDDFLAAVGYGQVLRFPRASFPSASTLLTDTEAPGKNHQMNGTTLYRSAGKNLTKIDTVNGGMTLKLTMPYPYNSSQSRVNPGWTWVQNGAKIVFSVTDGDGSYVCVADDSTFTLNQCVRYDNFTGCDSTMAYAAAFTSDGTNVFWQGTQGCVLKFQPAETEGQQLSAIKMFDSSTSGSTSNYYVKGFTLTPDGTIYVSTLQKVFRWTQDQFNMTDPTWNLDGAISSMSLGSIRTGSKWAPLVFDGYVYVMGSSIGNTDKTLYCFTADMLASQWMTTTSGAALGAVDQWRNLLYVVTANGPVAFSPQQTFNGIGATAQVWTYTRGTSSYASMSDDGYMVVTGSNGASGVTYRGDTIWENDMCKSGSTDGDAVATMAFTNGLTIVACAKRSYIINRYTGALIQSTDYAINTDGNAYPAEYIGQSNLNMVMYQAFAKNFTLVRQALPTLAKMAMIPTVPAPSQPNLRVRPTVGLGIEQWNNTLQWDNVLDTNFENGAFIGCSYSTTTSPNMYRFYTLEGDTGAYRWQSNTSTSVPSAAASCKIALFGPIAVMIVKSSGTQFKYVALNVDDGRTIWQNSYSAASLVAPNNECMFRAWTPSSGSASTWAGVDFISTATGMTDVGVFKTSDEDDYPMVITGVNTKCAAIYASKTRLRVVDGYGVVTMNLALNTSYGTPTQITVDPTGTAGVLEMYWQEGNFKTHRMLYFNITQRAFAWTSIVKAPMAPAVPMCQAVLWSSSNVVCNQGRYMIALATGSGSSAYQTFYDYLSLTVLDRTVVNSTWLYLKDARENMHRFNVQTGAFVQSFNLKPRGELNLENFWLTQATVIGTMVYGAFQWRGPMASTSAAQYNTFIFSMNTTNLGMISQHATRNTGSGSSFMKVQKDERTSTIGVSNGKTLAAVNFARGTNILDTYWNIIPTSFAYRQSDYYVTTLWGFAIKTTSAGMQWNVSLAESIGFLDYGSWSAYGVATTDGRAYLVADNNGTVCALNANTGAALLSTGRCMSLAQSAFAAKCSFVDYEKAVAGAFLDGGDAYYFGSTSSNCLFRLKMTGSTWGITAIKTQYSGLKDPVKMGSNIVVTDSVYIYTYQQSAFTATVGETYQAKTTSLAGSNEPLVVGSTLYITYTTGLVALTGSLQKSWTYRTQWVVRASAINVGSRILVLDAGGMVYAVDPSTRKPSWAINAGNGYQVNGDQVLASPQLGVVVIASQGGASAYDASGNVLWNDQTYRASRGVGAPSYNYKFGRIFPIPAQTCNFLRTADGRTYYSTCGAYLVARDIASGQILFDTASPGTSLYDLSSTTLTYPGTTNVFQQSMTVPSVLATPPPAATEPPTSLIFTAFLDVLYNPDVFQPQLIAALNISTLTTGGIEILGVDQTPGAQGNIGSVATVRFRFVGNTAATASRAMQTLDRSGQRSANIRSVSYLQGSAAADAQAYPASPAPNKGIKALVGVVAVLCVFVFFAVVAMCFAAMKMNSAGAAASHAPGELAHPLVNEMQEKPSEAA